VLGSLKGFVALAKQKNPDIIFTSCFLQWEARISKSVVPEDQQILDETIWPCISICTEGAPSVLGSLKGFVALAKQKNPDIIFTSCFLQWEARISKSVVPEDQKILDETIWPCISICTEGAPSVLGSLKGFVALAKQNNPDIIFTSCFLQWEARISKSVVPEDQKILDETIWSVNYLKSRPLGWRLFSALCSVTGAAHTQLLRHRVVMWLSRGRVLSRFYELTEELNNFFHVWRVWAVWPASWWDLVL
jgi:hypothetical protein